MWPLLGSAEAVGPGSTVTGFSRPCLSELYEDRLQPASLVSLNELYAATADDLAPETVHRYSLGVIRKRANAGKLLLEGGR